MSYKIQLVYNKNWWSNTDVKAKDEFDDLGSKSLLIFNILSKDYLIETIKDIYPNLKIKLIKDNFFSKKNQ